MEKFSVNKSFDLFIDTLGHLDEKHLICDSDLEFFVLEELDGDAYTFLHPITVDTLINAELVPSSIGNVVKALRDLIIKLLENKRDLHSIKNDIQWKNARSIAKSILVKIKEK